MAADVAGTLGQRNDPGSWPSSLAFCSSSCQEGKFSEVHLQNCAWGTGTPTGSAASNTQAQTSTHSLSFTGIKTRSGQQAALRQDAGTGAG